MKKEPNFESMAELSKIIRLETKSTIFITAEAKEYVHFDGTTRSAFDFSISWDFKDTIGPKGEDGLTWAELLDKCEEIIKG